MRAYSYKLLLLLLVEMFYKHLQILHLVVLNWIVESGWVTLDVYDAFLFIGCRHTSPLIYLALLDNLVSKAHIVEASSMNLTPWPLLTLCSLLSCLLINLQLFKERAVALIFPPLLPEYLNECLLLLECGRVVEYGVVLLLTQLGFKDVGVELVDLLSARLLVV